MFFSKSTSFLFEFIDQIQKTKESFKEFKEIYNEVQALSFDYVFTKLTSKYLFSKINNANCISLEMSPFIIKNIPNMKINLYQIPSIFEVIDQKKMKDSFDFNRLKIKTFSLTKPLKGIVIKKYEGSYMKKNYNFLDIPREINYIGLILLIKDSFFLIKTDDYVGSGLRIKILK